ncbi:MAG: helix-turn-helix transcriptional regulator [Caulobacteraceae bacterium]
MPKNPEPNYLKAWREYRRLTQAKLAEAIGTTGAVISLLEAGERRLSDKWLRKIAPVLGTRPGHLLEIDPSDVSTDILDIWAAIPEDRRDQARDVLKAFRVKEEPQGEIGEEKVVRLAKTPPSGKAPPPRRGAKAD